MKDGYFYAEDGDRQFILRLDFESLEWTLAEVFQRGLYGFDVFLRAEISADEKLDLLQNAARFLSEIEGFSVEWGDFQIRIHDFDIPKLLFLDDYQSAEQFYIANLKEKRLYSIREDENGVECRTMFATEVGADLSAEFKEVKEFYKRINERY